MKKLSGDSIRNRLDGYDFPVNESVFNLLDNLPKKKPDTEEANGPIQRFIDRLNEEE